MERMNQCSQLTLLLKSKWEERLGDPNQIHL